jgi:hypothetical protein
MSTPPQWPPHAPAVYAERLASVKRFHDRQMVGSARDRAGHFTSGLAGNHASLAMLCWGLNGNVSGFLDHLRLFAELKMSLVTRRKSGDLQGEGFITATSVRWVYVMLAGRQYTIAQEYVAGLAEFENEPYFRSMATDIENVWWDATRAVLLKQPDAEQSVRLFRRHLLSKPVPCRVPIANALLALCQDNRNEGDSLLARVAQDHADLYAREDPEDFSALLCMEGIALANLMTKRGWSITLDFPLIPGALVDKRR